MPWPIRRRILGAVFGYRIHPSARIGLSWIFPQHLEMAPGSRIGHFNVAVHLAKIELGENATIERSNWITGMSPDHPVHFRHLPDRDPSFVVGAHSAITKKHHFDCTDRIEIGSFTTVAGYHSQFLTHSIDVIKNRQDCAPIVIGDHCFIGTNVVALGGSRLPDCCVLAAKSLLNKPHAAPGFIYGGTPADKLKPLPSDAGYFKRRVGFVE